MGGGGVSQEKVKLVRVSEELELTDFESQIQGKSDFCPS